jgi:hypothetical protein
MKLGGETIRFASLAGGRYWFTHQHPLEMMMYSPGWIKFSACCITSAYLKIFAGYTKKRTRLIQKPIVHFMATSKRSMKNQFQDGCVRQLVTLAPVVSF